MLKIYLRINFLMMSFALMTTLAFAQNESTKRIFKFIEQNEVTATGERYTIPTYYKNVRINLTQLQNHLRTAPFEPVTTARLANGLLFEMPMPDGSHQRFQVFEYNVLHPDLAAKFPQIKTYTGQGIDDASATIKLDITQHGFHAMVRSPNGSVFIDPYNKNTTAEYICYYKKDLQRSQSFSCDQNAVGNAAETIIKNNSGLRTNGTQLRTYRLALSCTGEYAAFFGGTVSGATGGMTTTMNRVNGIYEDELSVRMVIVANNNLITYTNSSNDPFTNGNGSTMLGQNQTTCDNIIGTANYDIGHVVSTGGGGVAGLGVVCSSGNKARGVTGSGSPTGDSFDVDYVAHEIGHQFAGSHTFNSATGSCSGNRTSSAAYEPGSGITIQAYAGICGSDNLASNSIAYFHGYSLDQMIPFTTTGIGNNCPVTTTNGNTAPVVTNMAANCSIPISTPFVLTGAATDANGDVLTYSWEERDLGAAGAWNVQSTTAPQFRTFTPTTSSSRTFPKISDIINNTTTIGELLPNQARILKFRLTARDNRAGGGGIMHPDTNVIVTVVNSGGAFAVTSPNTAVTYAGGSTQAVTWNVSGTTANGINTANVKISLSTDGGNTFPAVLTASTANDGTESITIPNTATTTARIKVEAVGNIFFDMSNANFTITAAAGLTSITTSVVSPLNYCAGAAMSVSYTVNAAATAGNIFTAQLSSASGSFTNPSVPVTLGTLTSTTAGTISCIIPAGTLTGSGYKVRVVSSSPVVIGSDNGTNITISGQVGSAGNPQTGSSSYCANIPITFTVDPISNATTYNWTVNAGGIVNSGQGTTQVTIVFPPGQATTLATINVYGSNANCNGTLGSTAVTIFNSPNAPTANNVSGCAGTPITLSGSPSGGTFSVANPYTGPSTTYAYNVATFDGCNATSAPANITVNPLPAVTANIVSGCQGTAIALSGTPAGGTWSVANPYTGASTTYTHSFTDGNGCSNTSSSAAITANPLPAATTSPGGTVSTCNSSQTITAGSGTGLTYQWRVNGSNVGGATSISYNATANGNYDVIVTQSSCSATSATVVLTLGTGSPVITSSAGSSICAGSNTIFTAPAGATTYQWYKNSAAQPGATLQTFTASSNGTYHCNVTGTCSGSSNAIVLTEINNPIPAISNTTPLTFCNGGSVLLTSNTFAGVSFQWQKNSVDIAGATSQTYNANSTGTYRVRQTANGCFKNAPAKSVNAAGTSVTASISANGSTTFCNGGSVTLSVDNPITGYSYQWRESGVNIGGATSTSLVVTTGGSYTCLVTASCGNVSSNTIVVSTGTITATVDPAGTVNVCTGATVTLAANLGTGYTYQWKLNGVDINGATASTYAATAAGNYTVAITSSCGGNTSVATNINFTPLTATVSPSGTSVICAGFNITYIANTGFNFTYQWRRNGGNLAGATNATYIASSNGTYSVVITQAGSCSATSANATLSVTNNPTPTITAGGATTFCAGQSVTFTANTFAGVTYQWEKSGTDIAGATSQNYTATTTGSYKVRETANGCNKSSSSIGVTVNCRMAYGDVEQSEIPQGGEVIKVFPNPFADEFTVSVGSAGSPQDLQFTVGDKIQLMNMLGEIVLSRRIDNPTSNLKLQTSNLHSGIYFMQVTSSSQKRTIKVIKQ